MPTAQPKRRNGQFGTLPIYLRFHSRYWKLKNGCWEWQGARTTSGYGQLWVNGKLQVAHRVSWFLKHQPCDVKRCVNPDHLFLGTQSDNMRDAFLKRRLPLMNRPPQASCKRGHKFSADNTYLHDGWRRCKVCQRKRDRAYKARQQDALAALAQDAEASK